MTTGGRLDSLDWGDSKLIGSGTGVVAGVETSLAGWSTEDRLLLQT